jgi:two-component system chemotaxis response regulator CheY
VDATSPQTARTIMIVDDELFFRELLRELLVKEGFTIVAEATDGAEAVAKYRELRPDITVMDIFMPGENGIDATREIVSFDANAKVLICSGVGYDDDIEAATQAGARGIIYKPFMPAEVIETIARVTGGS